MITLRGVSKRFPGRRAPAVDDLDLEVQDGEVLGLVGLNGAGKTTTIRMATGLTRPTGGRIEIDGFDLATEKPKASASVGSVPELFPFEPGARADRLLAYYAGFHRLDRKTARTRARTLLDEVGLGPVHHDRIRTFSQGMKRRFGLAAAMISEPRHLLLDEVLNGLDPAGIAFVRQWTLAQKKSGKAILLSSHLLAELDALADRVAFLHRGRLLRTVTRTELDRASVTVLRVVLENPDPGALELLRRYGTVREEARTLVVSELSGSSAEVNAELVGHGYRVTELRVDRSSLEEYFFALLRTAG